MFPMNKFLRHVLYEFVLMTVLQLFASRCELGCTRIHHLFVSIILCPYLTLSFLTTTAINYGLITI